VHEFVSLEGGGVEHRSTPTPDPLLLLKPKKRGVTMSGPVFDALMITILTPAVYLFSSVFPLTSSFVFASIIYKI